VWQFVVVFTYSIRVLNLEWLDSGTTVGGGGLAKRTRLQTKFIILQTIEMEQRASE